MNGTVGWIAAQAEGTNGGPEAAIFKTSTGTGQHFSTKAEQGREREGKVRIEDLPAHGFCQEQSGACAETNGAPREDEAATVDPNAAEDWEHRDEERRRKIYRGRTISMLRQYMRYSHETGRLPSLLGREFFRAKVSSYTVVTFEDRVIFVHDMERCLERLDEFSRQLIARHILQEHDRWATARLLHCNEKTVRRLMPLALDLLSEILLEVGLLEEFEDETKSCQEGLEDEIYVSDCEDSKNKF
jgi:hypothetical protein